MRTLSRPRAAISRFPSATAGACALVALMAMVGFRAAGAERETPWEIAPYRVRVVLAVRSMGQTGGALEAAVARTIRQRADSALRPLWKLDLHEAALPAEREFCRDPQEIAWEDFSAEERAYDKLIWLAVDEGPAAFALTAREFDAYTGRWSPVLRRFVTQRAALGEASFRALVDVFSPLARIEPPGDDGRARLAMRGGGLPTPEGPDLLTAPGDVFLPLMRRTGRGGELVEGGVSQIPWTYLVAAEPEKSSWLADVETALRGPLAGRRRGATEQIAIGLPPEPEPARVRFVARTNREQGLAGYEVFRAASPGADPVLLGVTDREGVIVVPSGDKPVTPLLLRSDGQVLAKLVVAAGVAPVIDAPIADDAIRLAAQGEVQAVREELIDVVARRAILIARVEGLLKKGKVAEARELMDSLNELPTESVFAGRIRQVQDRLPPSEDAGVRQTVQALFSATNELLSRFLDGRVITNLQAQVNEAMRSGS